MFFKGCNVKSINQVCHSQKLPCDSLKGLEGSNHPVSAFSLQFYLRSVCFVKPLHNSPFESFSSLGGFALHLTNQ